LPGHGVLRQEHFLLGRPRQRCTGARLRHFSAASSSAPITGFSWWSCRY